MLKKLLSPKYLEYLKLQHHQFASFESESPSWSAGQNRFIEIFFPEFPRDLKILDIACGDGVGLKKFKQLGFRRVEGVENNPQKLKLARRYRYPVHQLDMHSLPSLKSQSYDLVYSSHTLEHAYDPKRSASELKRVLRDDGLLIMVLPYPDVKPESAAAHTARQALSLDKYDHGKQLTKFFASLGLKVYDQFFDTFREPEIWLVLCKQGQKPFPPYTPIVQKLQMPEYVRPFYLPSSYLSE